MSFERTPRILAVQPSQVEALFSQLLPVYGESLPDAYETIKTIGAFWDDDKHTRMRAASYPETISPISLTDGRVAFVALWQADLAAAFDAGKIAGAQQLTAEEFDGLRVKPTY